jgi:hypothetical protein
MRRACLTLCLLASAGSVGLWVRSYFAADRLRADTGAQVVQIMSICGGISLSEERITTGKARWAWDAAPPRRYMGGNGSTILGFRWGETYVLVPYWLPTLVSGLLSLWLWRRDRRRHGGRGFPVEKPAEVQSPGWYILKAAPGSRVRVPPR